METEEFVAFDRSPGSSDGEEYEGVGPIQESTNQRLPEEKSLKELGPSRSPRTRGYQSFMSQLKWPRLA